MRKTVSFDAVAEPFGSPDGSTSEFQLEYQGQKLIRPSYLNVTAMHQTDWQGRVALSNQPRTNIIFPMNGSSRVTVFDYGSNTTSITTGVMDPIGGNNAFEVITSAPAPNYAQFYFGGAGTQPLRAPEYISIWVKSSTQLSLTLSVNGIGAQTYVIPGTSTWTPMTAVIPTGSLPNGRFLQVDKISANCVFFAPMCVSNASAQPYIPTTSAPVTVTDYAVDSSGNVTLGQSSAVGATLDWDGSATCDFVDASATFLSQYATAPIITSLIQTANAAIDPQADFEGFLSNVWNIYTAQGFGLDIWGRIVNVPRTINIPASNDFFGFDEALPDAEPFNQAPFYSGPQAGTLYTLSDDAYRVLILTKALANISSFTAESMNALLNFMFNGQGTTRGSCYVLETATPMQIQYVFNFALQSWEAAILEQASLMPRPAGVGITIIVNP